MANYAQDEPSKCFTAVESNLIHIDVCWVLTGSPPLDPTPPIRLSLTSNPNKQEAVQTHISILKHTKLSSPLGIFFFQLQSPGLLVLQ